MMFGRRPPGGGMAGASLGAPLVRDGTELTVIPLPAWLRKT